MLLGRKAITNLLLLAAAAKSLQSCPTLCDPIDDCLPGSLTPGILQARTLEWVAISFSNAWKWKLKVKSLSRVWLLATPWTSAYQAPLSRKSVLNIHWKDWCWSSSTLTTWCEELTYWKRPWCWERLKAGGEGDNRGWDGWMASLTWWTWVWASTGSCWWTGKPGVLQSIGSQRVGHNWVTKLNSGGYIKKSDDTKFWKILGLLVGSL